MVIHASVSRLAYLEHFLVEGVPGPSVVRGDVGPAVVVVSRAATVVHEVFANKIRRFNGVK